MTPNATNDAHAPYVHALYENGDWASLVRYWMAHQYEAALARAIGLVTARADAEEGRWRTLANFLADVHREPISFERQPPDLDWEEWAPEQQVTLGVTLLYPAAAMCELARQAPLERQAALFRLGIESATQAQQFAESIVDVALQAFLLVMQAHGLREMRQFEAARDRCIKALAIHHELAHLEPDIYLPYVAVTLNSLGNLQRDLNLLEAARDSHTEALTNYRALARQWPEAYLADVARTLNNLGLVQRDLNLVEAARDSFTEALPICQELARQRSEVYLPDVAMTLNNLGLVQHALNLLEAARHSLTEALTGYRALAQQQPDVYWPALAMTLNNLGNVQRDLNLLEPARDSHTEALTIRRELARQRSEVYLPDVAMTLNNLGNVQRDLNLLELARGSYTEALTGYRALAQQQPDVYWPAVAMTLNNLGNVQRALNLLEPARDSYIEALTSYRALARQRPDVYLPDVAMTLNNLGNVQRDLNLLEPARDSLSEALTSYYALARQRPDVYLPAVAMTLNNLGAVQHALNLLEAARDSYTEALTNYRALARQRPDVYLLSVATTLTNLGLVQRDLNLLEAARDSVSEASRLYTADAVVRPTARLVERQHCWASLGQLFLRDAERPGWPDPQQARAAFREARACAERFRGQFRDPRQRRRVQAEAFHVYELLLQTCVDLGTGTRQTENLQEGVEVADWIEQIGRERPAQAEDLKEAVEVAEASRARNLMELLANETLQPANAPANLTDEFRLLRRHLLEAQRRLRDEEQRPSDPSPTPAATAPAPSRGETRSPELAAMLGRMPASPDRRRRLEQEVERLEAAHTALLQRIRTEHDPLFNPDQPVAPLPYAELCRLLPTDRATAAVLYCVTRERGLALVLTTGGIEAVALPELNTRQAFTLSEA
jgi:hypothetical protein